ncbi:MAG: ATP-binding protein [Alphaproteobacteria bacterium]|nr:ATP-binding protein [Alphaproteobacteria bacterium]
MLSSLEGFKSVVLDQLGEGVIVADADGCIISVNRAAELIHGRAMLGGEPASYTEDYELLTMDGDTYPPGELPLARAVLRGEHVVEEPWKIRRPDGSVVIAVGTARPIIDADGKQIGSVLTLRDDTRRVQAEQDLLKAIEMKELLLFEVNHRVRNSLQIVASLIALPMKRIDDEIARETLALTRQRIEVITATHRSLYELGTHDHVDCATLLPDLCAAVVQTYSVNDHIQMSCEVRGEIVLPVSKAVSVCLAVTELVTNACKYAFAGRKEGMVRVLLEHAGDVVRIEVEDNGVGMPDPVPHAKQRGIGTILVDSLAQSVGAVVEVETGESGTRFTITFSRPAEERDFSSSLIANRRRTAGMAAAPIEGA